MSCRHFRLINVCVVGGLVVVVEVLLVVVLALVCLVFFVGVLLETKVPTA